MFWFQDSTNLLLKMKFQNITLRNLMNVKMQIHQNFFQRSIDSSSGTWNATEQLKEVPTLWHNA